MLLRKACGHAHSLLHLPLDYVAWLIEHRLFVKLLVLLRGRSDVGGSPFGNLRGVGRPLGEALRNGRHLVGFIRLDYLQVLEVQRILLVRSGLTYVAWNVP